jgi:hypothetical protein
VSCLAGKEAGLSFSLLYAAPETVHAFTSGLKVVVADTAVDVFAFGIMCFELLTRRPYYSKGLTGSEVGDMLAGSQRLPHERLSPGAERQLGTLKTFALAPSTTSVAGKALGLCAAWPYIEQHLLFLLAVTLSWCSGYKCEVCVCASTLEKRDAHLA